MQSASFAIAAKLWALLCAMLGVFLSADISFCWILAALAFFYIACEKNWRLLRSFGAFYLLLALLMYCIRFRGLRMIIFSEFYVLMFWSLTPIFIVAWDLMTTPPGELSAFLSRIHFPSAAIIGLLVVFRFFPTMKAELRNVSRSMQNRRLTGLSRVVRHPLITCEYVLVPLLLRCIQIADDLSASAVARGAERPGVRGSYYARPLQLKDWICAGGWAIGTALFLLLGGVK